MPRLRILLLLVVLWHPGPAGAMPADPAPSVPRAAGAPVVAPAPPARPPAPASEAARCPAGTRCGGADAAAVCTALEREARAHALDPHFFARLIWRESLFDAAAVSPAGAQGIAQFMPATAALRGLADPFDPAEALAASAAYLAEMARYYGNIGLAAIAYNGGEARAKAFIAGTGRLPLETRAYVEAITGHPAEAWRDAPPAAVDLALAPGTGFHNACIRLAAARRLRAAPEAVPTLPWGVIIASHRDRAGAERQVERLRNRFRAILGAERTLVTHARAPGLPRKLHMAQIGRGSRAEADGLCARLRAAGGDCMVLRN